MRIRPLETADRHEWLRMRRALWPQADPLDLESELEDYTSGSLRHATLVTEREHGKLCGFIELSLRDYVDGCSTRPVGYIEGWFVDPDVRGRGLGRALVAAGEQWARVKGCTEMASDTELENTASQAAHAALGYRAAERIVIFVKKL